MKKFFNEFKAFIMRGNVLDMAVGVVVGSAFTKIVNSLVTDLFTPVISLLTKGIDISSLNLPLGSGEGAAVLAYGNFLQSVLEFLLVALFIFCVVKVSNKVNAKRTAAKKAAEAAKPAPAPAPSKEEVLLAEIRDLLKARQK